MMSARTLDVLLNGRRVGQLAETRKGARFQYDDSAVEGYVGRPLLSSSLPVKARPYAEGLVGAWFTGLLPEGERLARLCREIDCASSDYVGILAQVGWECAGAVSVVPEGFSAGEVEEPTLMNGENLAARLADLPSASSELGGVSRVSLGGFQEKLCVVARNVQVKDGIVMQADFLLPNAATISTHILKPQIAGKYPHLIESEAWAMAAASCAARCAKAALLECEGAPLTLCVERFDRKQVGGSLFRVHQEDCCQALGLPPSKKYASAKEPKGDDPTYVGIAEILQRYATDPREEMAELLRQITVNVALGNVDAHAKNYALLYETPCSPKLSPMYDVAPVTQIEPQAKHLSLRINGKVLADDVVFDDLAAEAQGWGLVSSEAEAVVERTLEALSSGIDYASRLYPNVGERFERSARARIEVLLRQAAAR